VAGLVTALLLGATAFVGVAALNVVPTLLPGALLVYLGLDLLHEWVYRAWFTSSRIDFLIIALIMGVIAARGFLAGIALGLTMAVVVFVVSASRTSVVKHALSGMEYRSRVTRGPGQQAVLQARGGDLYVLKLRGVIFFGTAYALYERIRARATDPGLPALRFVVLDFAQVTGLDSTGLLSFAKLRQLAQERRLTLVLTGLSGGVCAQFARGGFGDQPGVLRILADLDHGLEWCEDAIIAAQAAQERAQRLHAQPGAVPEQLEAIVPAGTQQVGRGSADQPPAADQEEGQSLRAQLEAILPPGSRVDRLLSHLQRQEVAAGTYLIRQGDDPGRLFFIESGQVTAQLEAAGRAPVRLETTRGGRVVGELGFYLGGKRTAAVVVDEPSTVYCLCREDLERIEGSDPVAALLLHRAIVHLVGGRVVHLVRAVEALER
jgi:SulP family sulfate permease